MCLLHNSSVLQSEGKADDDTTSLLTWVNVVMLYRQHLHMAEIQSNEDADIPTSSTAFPVTD